MTTLILLHVCTPILCAMTLFICVHQVVGDALSAANAIALSPC